VRLEGEVEWNFQKTAAERAVRLITGVRAVANFIQVKSKVSTGDVKQKIREAFERSAEIDSKRVGVDAHDGKVVLHGHVRSWLERNEAQRAAWSAPGVTSVVNELVVMP
jgi:osmotically-inducible protein OsmY